MALDAAGHAIEIFSHCVGRLTKLLCVPNLFVVAVNNHQSNFQGLPCANAACPALIHPASRNFSIGKGTFRHAGGSARGTYLLTAPGGSVVGSKKVRIGIVGIGNCASSVGQGLSYYRNAERK